MTDLIHNSALGRFAQWADNVQQDTPAASVLSLSVWDAGAEVDDTIRDTNTVAEITGLAGTTERTTNGWERKTLTQADVTVTVDDTANDVDVDIPDQTWTAVSAGASTDIEIGYDAAGTGTTILAGTWHDFAVSPDGSDVTAQIQVGGFYRAVQA